MSEMMLLESVGPVAVLTLNRAERHNSLVPELLAEMLAAFETASTQAEVRAVVLRANGRSFSTGGDVRGFYEHLDDLETYAGEIVGLLNRVILAMIELPVPIVAAVHGMVTGGSMGLILGSDIVLVAPEASFTPYYSVVGFSPDGGWTALLPSVIGLKRTGEILMRNGTITAEQAVAWGLASRIVPADRIREEALNTAKELAVMKAGSIGHTKATLGPACDDLEVRLQAERVHFVQQIVTDEARQGIEAFLGTTGPRGQDVTMSDSLVVGQVESTRRTFTQSDFDRFAALSGDDNPIHTDPEFSARTKFSRTVAHGMFLYSTVCGLLGTRLPGPGTVQVEQELMFPTATPTGEEVEIQAEVTMVQPAEGLAELATTVIRPDGSNGLQGRTLVRLPHASVSAGTVSQVPAPPAPDSQPFKGMELGQRAGTARTFTAADLDEYADLTGDTNPVITDMDHARSMGFEGPLVPGGLLGGLFSYLLGTRLPGPGTNYLKQRLFFPNPAYTGQELTARVEIVRLRPEKQLVNLSTVCADPLGRIVCHGEALVLASDV